ncbi:MAG: helix-turn-helix domain-containing protein, partial [Deltaproteobacteria bacterium]|nr:helix-turn-helix domain-containing protein [Candidatus Tharpellaceae bacterium]
LCRDGKIPAFKFGGQWRFDVKEIEKWKKRQKLGRKGE